MSHKSPRTRKVYARSYYFLNKESLDAASNARRRQRRKENPDKAKEQDRLERFRYYDQRKESTKHWKLNHPDYQRTPMTRKLKKAWWLEHAYGISFEQYESMLESQGWVCKICSKPHTEAQPLHVDHVHVAGWGSMSAEERRKYVRGLVCGSCNRALGLMKDRPDLLRKAADYLVSEEWSHGQTGQIAA